jgi:hypothetical protein
LAGQPHQQSQADSITGTRSERDSSVMATRALPIVSTVSAASLRTILAQERDPHRRQRALVRASLVAFPGKPRAPRPLTY